MTTRHRRPSAPHAAKRRTVIDTNHAPGVTGSDEGRPSAEHPRG
jgi:hypothetical protein